MARLGELAGYISRQPLLSEALALKGGTALNLGFGPPKRLSVDLDFNYVGSLERGKMLKDRPRIEEAISSMANRAGYNVQKSSDSFAGRKFHLQYVSALGSLDRIEVDVNYLFRLPLKGTCALELWQPGEIDRPSLRAVSLEELLLGKLLAFFDRCAPRDLWDLAHLPDHALWVVASVPFRPFFIAMSATLEHPISSYGRQRPNRLVTARAIKDQLLPMLIAGDKPSRQNLINSSWSVAGKFCKLAPKETEYVKAIERGELSLGLLFKSHCEEAFVLAQHPALLWKLANVREHLSDSSGKKKS